jgi:hypothetical protein
MILQRDAKIKIWGWAAKDEKVSISFNGKKYNTKSRRWRKMDDMVTCHESRRSIYDGYYRQ